MQWFSEKRMIGFIKVFKFFCTFASISNDTATTAAKINTLPTNMIVAATVSSIPILKNVSVTPIAFWS